MLASMTHTLIATGVQFNLFQFVPIAMSLNPFRTALTVIPYNVSMIIVVVATLRLLSLGDRFPPKYVVYSGIGFLGVGIVVLHRSLHTHVTSLQLIPGLIIMGIGSGLFLAYISRLTYSVASEDEKPEGSGIYNPIQNLGSSLGRDILGTALISFASRDIVDNISEKMGQTLSIGDRNQLITQLQEMIQTLSRQEVRDVMTSKLPPSLEPLIHSISLEAATSGMQTSLLIALVFTAICFLLATTLPKYTS